MASVFSELDGHADDSDLP